MACALGEADAKRKEGVAVQEISNDLKNAGLMMASDPARDALIKEAALRLTVRRFNEINSNSGTGLSQDILGGAGDAGGGLSDDEDVENLFP